MLNFLKKTGAFLKSRLNSFQKAFTILGCLAGLAAAIILIITGVAAIPFTGGASLLPTWVGISLFILLVTGSFGGAGKYIGMSIDTILDKEKPNNEKIATLAGCIIGAIVSILAIPLHFAGIAFIASKASIATWQVLIPFIPLTIGTFGSACAKIGKAIDALTDGKTIFDLFRSNKKKVPEEDSRESSELLLDEDEALSPENTLSEQPSSQNQQRLHLRNSFSTPSIHEHLQPRSNALRYDKNNFLLAKKVKKFKSGIDSYLELNGSHLGFFSRHFDKDRGINRANAYKALYQKASSSFERNVIAYSMLSSHDGNTLQKQVCKKMGFKSLEHAKSALKASIRSDMSSSSTKLDILDKFVIRPIVQNANTKKSVENGDFDNALDILRTMETRRRYA